MKRPGLLDLALGVAAALFALVSIFGPTLVG